MSADTVCYPGHYGHGWFPLIPLAFFGFWIVLLLVVRPLMWRRRGWAGPWGGAYGGSYGSPGGWSSNGSAEAVLAERYARGEVTEEEYRARLEVLRTRR